LFESVVLKRPIRFLEGSIVELMRREERESPRLIKVADTSSDNENGTDDILLAGARSKELVVSLGGSVYSDIIVTFERCHWLDRLTSIIILLTCLATQFMLVWSLVPEISGDDLDGMLPPKLDYNLFIDWKNNDGASVTNGQTWAAWACQGEDWSFYANEIGKMQGYAAPMLGTDKGTVFGCVAILLFAGIILKELRGLVDYVCLVFLPDAHDEDGYEVDADGETGHLVALSALTKVIVVLVALARLVISGLLFFYGARFLSYTAELKDFVLNSVALGFIFDLDELVFEAFVADVKKLAVTTLASPKVILPRSIEKINHNNAALTEICGVVGAGIAVALCYNYSGLKRFSEQWRVQALQQLCPPPS